MHLHLVQIKFDVDHWARFAFITIITLIGRIDHWSQHVQNQLSPAFN